MLLAAVAGVVLLLAAVLGAVGSFLLARVEAVAAADAAALAAAPVTFLPFGATGPRLRRPPASPPPTGPTSFPAVAPWTPRGSRVR